LERGEKHKKYPINSLKRNIKISHKFFEKDANFYFKNEKYMKYLEFEK